MIGYATTKHLQMKHVQKHGHPCEHDPRFLSIPSRTGSFHIHGENIIREVWGMGVEKVVMGVRILRYLGPQNLL
jgi:hypothetical protein